MSRVSICATILLLYAAVQMVNAHSWVACADYSDPNGQYYDDSKCRGYPRSWANTGSSGFGVDTGFNYQADVGKPTCRDPITSPVSAAYTEKYPMAKYTPGQTVCLVWPSKNHVAETCTNPFIPDTTLLVMLSPINPTMDYPFSTYFTNIIGNFSDHVNGVIDHKGFQNCPKFCENMDKSLCERCFTIPSTTVPGVYTMLWYWVFNAGSSPYTTCMDVVIGTPAPSSSSSSSTTGSPAPATTTTTTTTTAAATTTGGSTTKAAATTTSSSTTASSSTASTTGSSTGSISGSPLVVFDEALASGYTTAWSWGTTTSVVSNQYYTGSNALQAQMGNWAGLQFGSTQGGVQWQGVYTKITFALKSNVDANIRVWFAGGLTKVVTSTNSWSVYTFSLATDLAALPSLFNPYGLSFQVEGGPVTLWVDSLKLLP